MNRTSFHGGGSDESATLAPTGSRSRAARGTALIGAATANAAVVSKATYGTPDTATGAPGDVAFPEGIGLDPLSGRVALPDYVNDRVSVFGPGGAFLFAFGKDVNPAGGTGPEVCTTSCKKGVSGLGAGEIAGPEDAEFSPDGAEIFVVDAHRISVFDSAGRFKRAFGFDVVPGGTAGPEICTIATTCQDGVSSAAGGAFGQGWPLSFGPDGRVYVGDSSNNRISIHERNGKWLRVVGEDVNAATPGTGFESCSVSADCKAGLITGATGSLASVEGVDFGPDGRMWSDGYGTNQVMVFAPPPALTPIGGLGRNVVAGGSAGFEVCGANCQAGTAGAGPGEFSRPQGVAVAGDGFAYVSDSDNHRINVYAPGRAFVRSFGADVRPGGVTGLEECTVQTGCKAGLASSPTAFFSPYGVAVDCRGIVYVSNPSGPVPARAVGPPGVEPGPCELTSAGVTRNRRRGTATMGLTVPYPPQLELTGKKVAPVTGSHVGLEGQEVLTVRGNRKVRKRLRRKGKATVGVTVTMTPTDGNVAQAVTATVKLKRKRRR